MSKFVATLPVTFWNIYVQQDAVFNTFGEIQAVVEDSREDG